MHKIYLTYLYSSFGIPHLVHLSLITSSPTLNELCLIISGLSLEEYKDAEESILDCWAVPYAPPADFEPNLEALPQTLEVLLEESAAVVTSPEKISSILVNFSFG